MADPYDGFISYSHAADDLLAPRLQAGLQRFAKPWWKRRAIRVFRDEASLAANPHLWSSIIEALDDSGWFVLLLSEDAAGSEWVGKEIEHWVANKDPDRILPVVTDGEFTWENGDVDGVSTPPALRGVFSEEPRWVDLRFARGETHLDLQNPDFSAAVADIASAIRGIPKDELASEEVRQHRRTVRTAWAAGIALALLTVVALVAGVFAIGQRNDARDNAAAEAEARQEADANADLAAEEAERANAEAERANQEADRANTSAIEAARQAELARSREFAAAAVSVLDDEPELAMMLALQSIKATPSDSDASVAGVIALRQAMSNNKILKRFGLDEGFKFAQISPDGSTLFVSYSDAKTLVAVDAETEKVLWEYAPGDTEDEFHHVSVSPIGDVVTLSLLDIAEDGYPSRVLVFDAETGEITKTLTPGPCPWSWTAHGGFSPDGRYLAVSTGTEECFNSGPEAGWMAIYETEAWTEVRRIQLPGAPAPLGVSFSSDSTRVLIYDFNNSSGVESEVRTFPDLDLVARLPSTNQAALSPDGSRALVVDLRTLDLRPQLWDVDQNIRISYLDAVDGFLGYEALSFSPDGSQVAVLSEHGIFLFNGHSGRLDAALGRTDINHTSTFTRDSASLFTVSDADTILWDTGDALASAGTPLATAATPSVWINQDDVKEGPRLAIMTLIEDEATSAALQWGAAINLLDPDTGEVTQTFLGVGEQLPDGRFFLNRVESTDTPTGFDRIEGPLVIWDPDEGTVTEVTDCVELATAINRYEAECPVYRDLWASQDGAVLAAGSWVPITDPTLIRIWDASTLELLSEFETAESDLHLMHAGTDWLALFRGSQAQLLIVDFNGELIATLNAVNSILYRLAESPDGSTIFLRDLGGEVSAYDTSSWEHLSTWKAHESLTRGIAIHPDGHTLATTGSDGFVNVWEISALQELGEGLPPPLLDRIPTPVASDAAWLDDQTLMLFLRDGAKQMVISLGQEDVVADAVARLTRGFTLEECAVYQIGDCPTTLDAIREG